MHFGESVGEVTVGDPQSLIKLTEPFHGLGWSSLALGNCLIKCQEAGVYFLSPGSGEEWDGKSEEGWGRSWEWKEGKTTRTWRRQGHLLRVGVSEIFMNHSYWLVRQKPIAFHKEMSQCIQRKELCCSFSKRRPCDTGCHLTLPSPRTHLAAGLFSEGTFESQGWQPGALSCCSPLVARYLSCVQEQWESSPALRNPKINTVGIYHQGSKPPAH